jgi:molecular chaperone GrpE
MSKHDKPDHEFDAALDNAAQETLNEADAKDSGRLGNLTPEELALECEQAMQKAEENWDKFVRAQAEIENIRRGAERDVSRAHKFGSEKLLKELLPVADSLERGLETGSNDNPGVKALHEGMSMTLKLLQDALSKNGIKEVDPLGQPFSASQMEVVSMQPSDTAEPNTVIQVMQKGYLLNDRLLRPAMVIIAAKG